MAPSTAEIIERGRARHAVAAWEIDWNAPDDDDLLAFVMTQYELGKQRRRRWEAHATENLAYLAGEQDFKWNDASKDLADRIIEQELPETQRQRVRINTLKNFALMRMSLLLGVPLTWEVQPWSSSDDDMESARISTKLLQHLWGGADPTFDERLIDGLWMMFATGVVFPKVVWDPTLGPTRRFRPSDEDPDPDEKGGTFARWKRRIGRGLGISPESVKLDDDGSYRSAQGEVKIVFCSGFEITEPQFCQKLHEASWIIHSTWQDKERLIDQYGEAARNLNADNTSEAYDAGRRRMYGDYGNDEQSTADEAPAEQVLTHELWRPGTRRYPKGFRAVIADETVLRSGPHPYVDKRVPFGCMRELPDDRFRPACTTRMLIELQDAHNRHRTQMAQHINKIMDPRMITEKGSGFPEDGLTSEGGLIEVNTGKVDAVKPLEVPQLPAHATQMDEMYRRDMQDVALVHDSSLGKAESSQQSGKHAQLLQQSDQRGNTVTKLLVQKGLEAIGTLALWRYYQYVRVKRAIAVGGPESRREVLIFMGKDLRGRSDDDQAGPDSFAVRVQLGAEPNTSGQLEKAKVLMEIGYFDPKEPEDRYRIARLLGENVVRDDDDQNQRTKAADENSAMLDGKQPSVARGDDDILHIIVHEKFTTTARFRKELAEDPTLAVRVETHIREHIYQRTEEEMRPDYIRRVVKANLDDEYRGIFAQLGIDPQADMQPPSAPGGGGMGVPPGAAPIPGGGVAGPVGVPPGPGV